MNRRWIILWVAGAAALVWTTSALPAAGNDAKPPADPRLDAVRKLVTETAVVTTVRDLVAMESRVLGYPGNAKAADYVIRRLGELGYGEVDPGDATKPEKEKYLGRPFVEGTIRVDTFEAPVPLDEGTWLESDVLPGVKIPMHPLWPNLVRTPQLPRTGVTGHLVWAGSGTYAEMDKRKMYGSIALMDFNCEKRYMDVRDLGAQAVVFVEPEDTTFEEASVKMLEIPVNVPRYWLKREDALKLVRAVLVKRIPTLTMPSGAAVEGEARKRGIETDGKSEFDVMLELFGKLATGMDAASTVSATAHCRMPWVRATGRNIYTILYGTDPELRREVVVVQAFYDSMSVVPGVAPGADSTGGIAGLLEMAKVLKAHPPKRSVMLLATGSHFVSWEGIADWMLRHGARGGTEVLAEKAGGVSMDQVTWMLRIVSLALAAGLVVLIVVSTQRMRHWHNRVAEDPQAERRASGMSSLRFVSGIFLIPVALIALLANLEQTFESKTLEPMTLEHDAQVKFYFSLDLSSDAPDLGLFFMSPGMFDKQWDWPGKSHRNYMRQYSKRLTDFAAEQKIDETLGVRVIDCVEPKGREESDYVPLPGYLLDGNVILRTGNPCVSFMTIEDCRRRVDTPLDNLDRGRVNTQNLTRQLVAVCSLVTRALDEPEYTKQTTQQQLKDRVKEMTTRVVEANYRESFVADTPVVDALVVYRQGWSNFIAMSHINRSGVRGLRVRMTDERGLAYNPFLQADGPTRISGNSIRVRAYKLSADDGRIIYALDRGEQGAKSYPIDVTVSHPVYEHQVVAFQCEPIDFYHLDNARYLRAVGAGRAETPIIFDANDATPQEFGFDLQESVNIQTGESTNCAVVYVKTAPAGTEPNRVKLLTGSVVFGLEYLATNTEGGGFETEDGETVPKHPEGVGYPGAPPYVVFNSALAAARDMIRIDRSRMERFEKYAVVKPHREGAEDNQRLPEITHRAQVHLEAAAAALADYRYHDSRTHLDKALGFEARAYPDVKGTANDIVKGFMFYCVLLLPFAFFCERLFFGFTDIRKQLFGFAAFFLAIFAVMAFVHPVFRITDAPYVILLAFVILVLALSVLFIIIAKFNEQMAKMRRKAAKVHEADVGRLSASGTAVLLGISNMKKRKVRTTLTTLTLILLTFTVMSFTSVKTETVYNEIPQSHKASWTGVLLRDLMWNAQEPMALEQFRRHFESNGSGKVIPRAWVSASARGAKNYKFILYASNGRQTDCSGAVGYMPEETRALWQNLHTDGLLVAGRWFEKPHERSVILPSHVAYTLLGFTPEDVAGGTATVRLRGWELTLVGVLDSARLEQVRDLDDEAYPPIDLSSNSAYGERLKTGHYSQNIVDIVKQPHLSTAITAIVPYGTARDMGGRIASAAVVFGEGYDFESDVKEFLERVGMTVFVGTEGQVKAYSSIALSTVGNVGNLFVPILIAALIVLNTMMGSVHERAHEIGIYSSVGLAPVHIAALFLAESCVYAVMGAISGYLLGTVVGAAVAAFDIKGLTLNYSSLSAVFSTVVVMATVVLSTLYPAKIAANMSVPDVTRQWKFPDPEGDLWKFDFPFTVASRGVLGLFIFLDNYFDGYKEESIGSFYADHIRVYSVEDTYGTGYVVELDCWLAPFDLSVSQNVQLRALPTEDEGITRIEMQIRRLSGEVSNWMRLNRGFLTLMRKQFLIWRTVSPDVKETYRQQGEERLKTLSGAANV